MASAQTPLLGGVTSETPPTGTAALPPSLPAPAPSRGGKARLRRLFSRRASAKAFATTTASSSTGSRLLVGATLAAVTAAVFALGALCAAPWLVQHLPSPAVGSVQWAPLSFCGPHSGGGNGNGGNGRGDGISTSSAGTCRLPSSAHSAASDLAASSAAATATLLVLSTVLLAAGSGGLAVAAGGGGGSPSNVARLAQGGAVLVLAAAFFLLCALGGAAAAAAGKHGLLATGARRSVQARWGMGLAVAALLLALGGGGLAAASAYHRLTALSGAASPSPGAATSGKGAIRVRLWRVLTTCARACKAAARCSQTGALADGTAAAAAALQLLLGAIAALAAGGHFRHNAVPFAVLLAALCGGLPSGLFRPALVLATGTLLADAAAVAIYAHSTLESGSALQRMAMLLELTALTLKPVVLLLAYWRLRRLLRGETGYKPVVEAEEARAPLLGSGAEHRHNPPPATGSHTATAQVAVVGPSNTAAARVAAATAPVAHVGRDTTIAVQQQQHEHAPKPLAARVVPRSTAAPGVSVAREAPLTTAQAPASATRTPQDHRATAMSQDVDPAAVLDTATDTTVPRRKKKRRNKKVASMPEGVTAEDVATALAAPVEREEDKARSSGASAFPAVVDLCADTLSPAEEPPQLRSEAGVSPAVDTHAAPSREIMPVVQAAPVAEGHTALTIATSTTSVSNLPPAAPLTAVSDTAPLHSHGQTAAAYSPITSSATSTTATPTEQATASLALVPPLATATASAVVLVPSTELGGAAVAPCEAALPSAASPPHISPPASPASSLPATTTTADVVPEDFLFASGDVIEFDDTPEEEHAAPKRRARRERMARREMERQEAEDAVAPLPALAPVTSSRTGRREGRRGASHRGHSLSPERSASASRSQSAAGLAAAVSAASSTGDLRGVGVSTGPAAPTPTPTRTPPTTAGSGSGSGGLFGLFRRVRTASVGDTPSTAVTTPAPAVAESVPAPAPCAPVAEAASSKPRSTLRRSSSVSDLEGAAASSAASVTAPPATSPTRARLRSTSTSTATERRPRSGSVGGDGSVPTRSASVERRHRADSTGGGEGGVRRPRADSATSLGARSRSGSNASLRHTEMAGSNTRGFPCPRCGKVFADRIVTELHLRNCSRAEGAGEENVPT